jgi:predicted DsbA family dithiol-disulfide isomerase
MSGSIKIDYYSDILCVWAWIAQRRIEEIETQWGDQVTLQHHYVNLFGDTATRIGQQWADRGSFDGFGQHVIDAAAPYDRAPVTSGIWKKVRPATSANAHLLIKAVELARGAAAAAAFALTLREEFFVKGQDIGDLKVVMDIADGAGLDAIALKDDVNNGAAMAALMSDYKDAQDQNVKGSPTWIMNSGRQILYGNVGYRVLHANIEEILKRPEQEASWC